MHMNFQQKFTPLHLSVPGYYMNILFFDRLKSLVDFIFPKELAVNSMPSTSHGETSKTPSKIFGDNTSHSDRKKDD